MHVVGWGGKDRRIANKGGERCRLVGKMTVNGRPRKYADDWCRRTQMRRVATMSGKRRTVKGECGVREEVGDPERIRR